MLWNLTKKTSEDVGILDSENGSVTESFSKLVLDNRISKASLLFENGSESTSENSLGRVEVVINF